VNKPEKLPSDEKHDERAVFVSYATADRKQALAVCKAIERRGTKCWISSRDVEPGDNYQEAIVSAIQTARAMVLVFSEAANNSNEIKKELSLASRFGVTVIALRIEDVEPSSAFAYELSTRQWIDAFEGWDKSLDSLVQKLDRISGGEPAGEPADEPAPGKQLKRRRVASPHKLFGLSRLAVAASVAVLMIAGVAAWLLLRPSPAAAHSMMVRLAGFERLSPDLPAGMPDAIRDEMIAAFSDDGVVGVSTANAPAPGNAPAYALGGTVRRDGDKIRVIARLTDERTGALLWSNSFSYDSKNRDDVPRWLAVDAGNLVRCGLFGASTYPKPLPDSALSDYLGYCHNDGYVDFKFDKAIWFGQKVVAAVPDFSWGWSAIAMAASDEINELRPANSEELRAQGMQAAATALKLDPTNSEALTYESVMTDSAELTKREALLQKALTARPLACGCEHHYYGIMLDAVGRNADALDQYYRAVAVQALNPYPQMSLGLALFAAGKPDEAKPHIDKDIDLVRDPWWQTRVTVEEAPYNGNFRAAAKAVRDPAMPMSPELRSALTAGFDAVVSGNPAAKSAAAAKLAAIPANATSRIVVATLGALGANRLALERVEAAAAAHRFGARTSLFVPSMAGALRDPQFPAVAERLGLMRYWKASHTRPDACGAKNAPPFCRVI
jgi:tetratricopeptide (TPR) repeat protein